jgi:BatD DUF11 like domain
MNRILDSQSTRWLLFLSTLVMATSGQPLMAFQQVSIRVKASAEEIYSGDQVDFVVEIQNAGNADESDNIETPNMSAVEEFFDVQFLGDSQNVQQSISIINGRVSRSEINSHVYKYRLTPMKTGTISIPPVTVTVDGKTSTSGSLPLRVIEPEPQDICLVEMQVEPKRVYPTQPFTVTTTVWVKPLPDDESTNPLSPLRNSPPVLQANWIDDIDGLSSNDRSKWLNELLARNGIGFALNHVTVSSGSLFGDTQTAAFDISKGREARSGLDGKEIRYFKYQIERTFYAKKTGTYSLGPSVVKGTFVSGVRGDRYLPTRLVTASPTLRVEVRDVPTPQPPTYCGGIGDFNWTVTASPKTLRVGDPLTLSIDVSQRQDSGSLDLISAPNLSAMDALTNDFDLIDSKPTGRLEGDSKKFSYALRPKRAGANIPELMITTFDPSSEQFREQTIAGVTLDVSESIQLSSGELVGSVLPSNGSSDIKTRVEGIFQNITDPGLVRDQQVPWMTWSAWVGGSWIVALVAIGFIKRQRRNAGDTVGLRKRQARQRFNGRMTEARQWNGKGNRSAALRTMKLAVLGWIADTRNLLGEGLTVSDVVASLTSTAVPEKDRTAVARLLETVEAAEFGGGITLDVQAVMDEAENLVARLAPILERGA